LLIERLRALALGGTEWASARLATLLRTKLPRIGALIVRNSRRIRLLLASGYAYRELLLARHAPALLAMDPTRVLSPARRETTAPRGRFAQNPQNTTAPSLASQSSRQNRSPNPRFSNDHAIHEKSGLENTPCWRDGVSRVAEFSPAVVVLDRDAGRVLPTPSAAPPTATSCCTRSCAAGSPTAGAS
jgi:hypothetical protein